MSPKLIYEYSKHKNHQNSPVGYREDGSYRFLSTSPSCFGQLSREYSPLKSQQSAYKNSERKNGTKWVYGTDKVDEYYI